MHTIVARTLVLLLSAVTVVHAQVPQLINYQGRIAVGGVNFDGSGQFKFALVDAAGTISYWSNDGASIAGSEPAAAVTLTVSEGHYSVLLGDTTLPNMAAIPAGVFNDTDVSVRVWFNDGTNGSQRLTPDQRIATPTPLNARGVRGGSHETATDAWRQRVNVAAPLGRRGHSAVWTGSEMIVWGGTPDLLNGWNTGGRYRPAGNRWTAMTTSGAPAARRDHTAVWTGREMIVLGGRDSTRSFSDTFSYTPGCEPFRITNAVLEGGALKLTFPAVPGRTYTLWRSDSLADGTWINTGLPALAGTGATLTFTIPVPNSARSFFRVQADA
jgi:hypothetical protein